VLTHVLGMLKDMCRAWQVLLAPPQPPACEPCSTARSPGPAHLQAARQRRPAKKAARGTQTEAHAGAATFAGPLRGGLGFGALTACTGRRRKPHVSADDAAPGTTASPGAAGIEDASKWIEAAVEVCFVLCPALAVYPAVSSPMWAAARPLHQGSPAADAMLSDTARRSCSGSPYRIATKHC
jgi:hypothetical protein